jgi:hypothetical protein
MMPEVIELPKVKMNGKIYFLDRRLGFLRNVDNPHDQIPTNEAFVRVKLAGDYVVLNDAEMVRRAKEALIEDVSQAVLHDDILDWVQTEPEPAGHLGQIENFLLEEMEEDMEEEDPLDAEYNHIYHEGTPYALQRCGCCECFHRPGYTGDCRNDAERFPHEDALKEKENA